MVRKIPFSFFVLLITFFLFGYFSLFFFDTAHDGIVLVPALDVLHGKMLFRDTFTQYGPLFTIFHAIGMKIFGESVYSIRLVTLTFYGLTAVVLWNIQRRFLSTFWTGCSFLLWLSLSPVYWWYFHSWSSVQSAFFQVLSLFFFIRYIEQQKNYYLVLTGFVSVIAFWCRQPVGFFNTLACLGLWSIIAVLRLYPRRVLIAGFVSLLLGILLGLIPVFVWLILNHALKDWWLQSIVMEIPFAQNTRGISPSQLIRSLSMSRYWKMLPNELIWLLIPLSTALTAFFSFRTLSNSKRKFDAGALKLLLITGIGLASWHQYYPVTEPLHFFWAATPMIGIFVLTLSQVVKKMKRFQIVASAIILVIIGSHLLWQIRSGLMRVRAASATSGMVSVIAGVPMRPYDKLFVDNTTATLARFFSLYPDKTYINDSHNSFYPLFFPSHFASVHGIFVDWGILTTAIYPTFIHDQKEYVRTKQPLVFSRFPKDFPDYCDMNVVTEEDPPVRLLIPREIGMSLQHTWTQGQPNLRPFTCN